MKGGIIAIEDIPAVWPHVEKMLAEACEFNGGRYLAEDYLNALLKGEKQLWLAIDDGIKGVVVSQIVEFPRKKVCSIDICTGVELEHWGHMVALVEEWGKLQGCEEMFVIARTGMKPLLKCNNYTGNHILMEKAL